MATKIGDLYYEVDADTSNIGDKIEKDAKRAGTRSGRVAGTAFSSSAASTIKKLAVGIVSGFVVKELFQFAKSTVQSASDLREATTLTGQVFKEEGQSVLDWAKNSDTAFGQSERAALQASSTYASLFQAFGVGIQTMEGGLPGAKDMSLTLTQLASDLASFRNTSVDEALTAIQSGISGEMEPLRRYGVVLSDVRLKQKAFEMGLISSTKDALTPATKAQATYALIMQDTTLAQGDFARTSGDLANMQRSLGAQWENLKAKMGNALLPVVKELVSWLSNSLLPAIERLYNWAVPRLRKAFQSIADWVKARWPAVKEILIETFEAVMDLWKTEVLPALKDIGEGLRTAFQWIIDNKPVLIGILTGLGAAFVTYYAIQVAGALAAAAANLAALAPFIAIGVAVAALVAGLIYAYQNWEWFRTAVQAVGDWFKNTWLPLMISIWQWLFDNVPPIIQAIADFIMNVLWPAMQTVFGWINDNVVPIFQAIASFITNTVIPALQSFWSFLQDKVWPILQTIAGAITDVVVPAFQTFIDIVTTTWDWLQDLWDRSEGLRQFLVGYFTAGIGIVVDATKKYVDMLITTWAWLQALWNMTEAYRQFLVGTYAAALGLITDYYLIQMAGIIKLWGWLQLLWDKTEGLREFLAGTFLGVLGDVIGFLQALYDMAVSVGGGIDAIADAVGRAIGPLERLIDLAGKIKNAIPGHISVPSVGGGGGNNGGGGAGAYGVPGSAVGGPIMRNETHLVGEDGPEWFTAKKNGWIIPNTGDYGKPASSSGNVSIGSISVSITGTTNMNQDELASAVQNGTLAALGQYIRARG